MKKDTAYQMLAVANRVGAGMCVFFYSGDPILALAFYFALSALNPWLPGD